MTSDEFILAGDFLLTMDGQNRVIPDGAVHIAAGYSYWRTLHAE